MVTFAFHRGSPLNFLAVFKGPLLVREAGEELMGKKSKMEGRKRTLREGGVASEKCEA